MNLYDIFIPFLSSNWHSPIQPHTLLLWFPLAKISHDPASAYVSCIYWLCLLQSNMDGRECLNFALAMNKLRPYNTYCIMQLSLVERLKSKVQEGRAEGRWSHGVALLLPSDENLIPKRTIRPMRKMAAMRNAAPSMFFYKRFVKTAFACQRNVMHEYK